MRVCYKGFRHPLDRRNDKRCVVKETFTKKLYHKRFTHRMYIKVENSFIKNSVYPPAAVVSWIVNKTGVDYKTQSSYHRVPNGRGWNYRYQNFITVFYSDEALTDILKKEFGQAIIELERPRDSAHLQILQTEKVLTRKALFFKKFRVVCRTTPRLDSHGYLDKNHIAEMKSWCEENLSKGDWRADSNWNSTSFFFVDRKSAMHFKIVWNLDIKSTERIVLLDEIDNDDIE